MTGGWLLLVTSMAAARQMWSRCRGSCILGACRVKFMAARFSLQLPSRSRSQPACEHLFVYLFMYIRPASARSLALLLLK